MHFSMINEKHDYIAAGHEPTPPQVDRPVLAHQIPIAEREDVAGSPELSAAGDERTALAACFY